MVSADVTCSVHGVWPEPFHTPYAPKASLASRWSVQCSTKKGQTLIEGETEAERQPFRAARARGPGLVASSYSEAPLNSAPIGFDMWPSVGPNCKRILLLQTSESDQPSLFALARCSNQETCRGMGRWMRMIVLARSS